MNFRGFSNGAVVLKTIVGSFFALLICAVQTRSAIALPFNDDMVDVQKRTGVMMRSKPSGSVPLGSLAYRVDSREDAKALTNPVKSDATSVENGSRLFKTNCSPCHGNLESKDWTPGPVGQKWPLKIPDLRGNDPARMKDYRTLSDSYFFEVIHFGFGTMSGYGWKLSPTEHWNIINYIRSVQTK